MKIRLGVLISGRGSNLAALIQACQKPHFPAEIAVVISDKSNAPGLRLAELAGIPTAHVSHPSQCGFAADVDWPLVEHKVDLIVLAGFMRILHRGFVVQWEGRIINIHPSLLPDFPGLHPQRKAIEANRTISGCTVHWVVPEVDAGLVIAQAVVNIHQSDTEDTLAARILEAEHKLYPLAISMIANEMLQNNKNQDTSIDMTEKYSFNTIMTEIHSKFEGAVSLTLNKNGWTFYRSNSSSYDYFQAKSLLEIINYIKQKYDIIQ